MGELKSVCESESDCLREFVWVGESVSERERECVS